MDKHFPRSNLLADFGPFQMDLPTSELGLLELPSLKNNSKKVTKHLPTSSLCYCGQQVKVGEVKKAGPNCGKTFYTCNSKLYNPETKESFGGCIFFQFKGDTIPYCPSCNLPMRLYKNILSSAKCMNQSCKLKLPNTTEEERATVARIIGGDLCTCGEHIKIFKRPDGCSVSATCGQKGDQKCSFRYGLDLKTEQVYFSSK